MTLLEQRETLNLLPMVRTLKVLDKAKNIVPFEPNWAQMELLTQIQKDYEAGIPSRFIILKARQIGISTLIEAVIFCLSVMMENSESVVASLDTEQAEYLFGMTRLYYDEWAFKEFYPEKYISKRQLAFKTNNSDIKVKTGENPKAFRGRTYRAAHISEIAFWSKPVEAMLAINAGMPRVRGNFQFIESTANGLGNWFEEAWVDAVEGRSGYTPFFFPWWKHYEYIPCEGQKCRDGTCEACLKASRGLKPRDSDERSLIQLGASRAHIAWRRHAIPSLCFNNLDLFHQEYPSTAEEAFIASGMNTFNLDDLKAVYNPEMPAVGDLIVQGGEVKFIPDPLGPLRMYRQPAEDKEWSQYFIGADPSYGVVDGDYAAAHVINRRTKEQVAVYRAKISPSAFADELTKLGKFYGGDDPGQMPVIACEAQGPGLATNERLRHIYPRVYQRRTFDVVPGQDRSERTLGWSTDWKTKTYLCLTLSEFVQKGMLSIHDEATFKEMRTHTFYGNKGFVDKFGPGDKDKGHDDLVMSLAIAIVCEAQEGVLPAYEVIDNPDGVIWSKEQPEEEMWS